MFIFCCFSWPRFRANAYCSVPIGSLSSDRRSICICAFLIPWMNILFTRLSSSSSQLHSAAFCLFLLWNFSRGWFASCLQLKNWYLSSISIFPSLKVSLSCSMNASVVHFEISVCGSFDGICWLLHVQVRGMWGFFYFCICLFPWYVVYIGTIVFYSLALVLPVYFSFDVPLFPLSFFCCCFLRCCGLVYRFLRVI